jgi:hypothetical protein
MHPSIRIILLFILAVAVYGLSGIALNAVFVFAILCLLFFDLIKLSTHTTKPDGSMFAGLLEFIVLVKRVRYILLFLFIVYVFNTPGEYLPGWDFSIAPTYEGIASGTEQVLRLTIILAGLALLWVTTNRQQLIAGLYYLAKPFGFLGLDPERFAVRLWLTLYYAEHGAQSRKKNSIHDLLHLEKMLQIDNSAPEKVVLIKPQIRRLDILTLVFIALLGAYLLCA